MIARKKTSDRIFAPYNHKGNKTNPNHLRKETNTKQAPIPKIFPPPKTTPMLIKLDLNSNKKDSIIKTQDEVSLIEETKQGKIHHKFEEIVIDELKEQIGSPVDHEEEVKDISLKENPFDDDINGLLNTQLITPLHDEQLPYEPLEQAENGELEKTPLEAQIEEVTNTENAKIIKEKDISIFTKPKKKYSSSIIINRGKSQIRTDKSGSIRARKVKPNIKPQSSQSKHKHWPIIKVPILLSRVNIDYDIIHSSELLLLTSSIVKTNLTVHSYQGRILLPSNTLFLKGIFILDVEFTNQNDHNTIHNKKITIPWEKTTTVNWINQPCLSSRNEKQHMFQSSELGEINFHHQSEKYYADPIQYELQRLNLIWHDEFKPQIDSSLLCILGTAQLSFNLLQRQLIDLNLL